MGRRALRKLDPQIDLSTHLRELTQLLPQTADPATSTLLDPQTFFPQAQPLEIEMGSGKGLFLLNAAQTHPSHNFLGVELAHKYAEYCAARMARHALPNARMISGDGVRMFHELLPTACATAVHVYFPDPWWKARHHKRRVMNAGFVRDVERVLLPGATLHFWTDVEEYYLGSLELLATETTLSGPHPVDEPTPTHDLDYRTNFERRKRQAGLPIFRAEFRKAS